MKLGIVVFPGSNCDRDVQTAARAAGYDADFIWHTDTSVDGFDCLALPGGFSYGDYLRTAAIARFSPVMEAVARYAALGRPVIGICNGFQVLLEAGLLPGAMLRNTSCKFVCKPQRVRVEVASARTPFTLKLRPGQVITLPIAHGEGTTMSIARPGTAGTRRPSGVRTRRVRRADGGVLPQREPGQHSRHMQQGRQCAWHDAPPRTRCGRHTRRRRWKAVVRFSRPMGAGRWPDCPMSCV